MFTYESELKKLSLAVITKLINGLSSCGRDKRCTALHDKTVLKSTVLSRKRCKMDTLLREIINRRRYIMNSDDYI